MSCSVNKSQPSDSKHWLHSKWQGFASSDGCSCWLWSQKEYNYRPRMAAQQDICGVAILVRLQFSHFLPQLFLIICWWVTWVPQCWSPAIGRCWLAPRCDATWVAGVAYSMPLLALWRHLAIVCCLLCNLVDSASSDTLSLRTKPCMCKYKNYTRLRMAHYISYSLFDSPLLLG